ncbi:T9SS type A sorting domain-containing protein [Flavobacterium sp.]|uniref:T9SS type A sorting domain-containing protein n=2 Tax=Flavobacterium sp. TaxID=239 RepID=UPI004047900D
MKKTLLLLTLAFTSYNYAQNVDIPDANFKNALLAHGVTITGSGISKIDTNDDGEIQVTEAEVYTGTINVGSKNISSLTGIEAFVNIIRLYCSSNQLTSFDVSSNIDLISLDCSSNQLTSLDVTQNVALMNLYCYNNQLTSLNVIQNTAFKDLRCQHNQLTSLDVTQNTALTHLYCFSNQLTSLDVTQNVALTYLYCYSNQLTSLNVIQNTALINLRCQNNQLANLDVTQNSALEYFYCSNNQLINLNIANGNNNNLTYFFSENNPNLACIQIDNGFTPPSNSNWLKDATASYSANCTLSTNNFELSKQVVIYPNPAKDHFQIDLENSLELKAITVYNNLGQQVLITNTSNVNTNSLSKGMYYVEIVTNAGKANKKIIIE